MIKPKINTKFSCTQCITYKPLIWFCIISKKNYIFFLYKETKKKEINKICIIYVGQGEAEPSKPSRAEPNKSLS